MEDDNALLRDIINILPEGIECYIQAPSLEDEEILNMWVDTEYPYYKKINLDKVTRERFLNRIANYSIAPYFQSMEIKFNGKLLFEGNDGIEYGTLSNTISIPSWFKRKYAEDEDYFISDKW